MIQTLRKRDFALLWFAGLISMVGDWVLIIALPIYTYDLTNSTLATGLMFIIGTIPRIAFGSLAGVFVDRWDRKKVMVASDFLRAIVILFLLLVRDPGLIWIIYCVAFLQSSLSMFFGPAENALLPQLVDPSRLVSANALNSLNNNLARLAGPALGGLLYGALGFSSSVIINSLSFVLSGVMILLISSPGHPISTESAAALESQGMWAEWKSGLCLIRSNPVVSGIFAISIVSAIGEGIFNIMFVIFIRTVLNGGAMEFGWLSSGQAVGGIVGGLLVGRIGRRVPPNRLTPLLAFNGILILLLVHLPWLPLSMFFILLCGIPLIFVNVGVDTLLQKHVEGAFLGRVFGTLMTTMSLFILLGQGIATITGDQIGPVILVSVKGLLDISGGLLALWLLVKRNESANAIH